LIQHSKSRPVDEKSSCFTIVLEFYTLCNISAMANAKDFKFCTRVGHAVLVL